MAVIQPRLIEAQMHLSDGKSRAVGAWGEVVARVLLERAGYETVTMGHGSRRGDLLAIEPATGERWRIEVKTARRGKHGLYQFTVLKDDKYGHTDYRDADALLLLAVSPAASVTMFLIPSAAVGRNKAIKFHDPTSYAGRWAAYRVHGPIRLECCRDQK